MNLAAVQAVFDAYADAFARQDADALTASWAFPALVSGPAGSFNFDAATFRRNLMAMFGFYNRQAVAKTTAQVTSVQALSDTVVLARIDYAMATADDVQIVRFDTAYLLRASGDALLKFAAISDGEMAAWAARGTPLGSRA
ncbi:nuclear transport factor 2 family protein [Sandarakinorhabdus sp.]|uniref:nuclear transport factor 2 family protein n=1 Tax=Sandarakinorhabdus sp. TaxID=1916663 RepID=UPI003F72B30F